MARHSSVVSSDSLARALLLGAAALVVVGVVVLAGWAQRIDLMIRFQPGQVPMGSDMALSLVVIGGVLLARQWTTPRTAWLLVLPAAIGLLSLQQPVSGWDPRINELLQTMHLGGDGPVRGAMLWPSALALLSASLCLVWLELGQPRHYRSLVISLVSSLVISLGLAHLLGLILGLSEVSGWNRTLRPEADSSLCLLLLGHLMLCRVWHGDRERAAGLPDWLPVPLVAAGATLTLLFTAALRDRELSFVRSTTQLTIDNTAALLNLELDNQAKTLQRIGGRWMEIDHLTDAIRNRDGVAYQQDFPAVRSLTWIDDTFRTQWVYPASGNAHLLDYDHAKDGQHRTLIEQVRRTGQPAFSPLISLPMGGKGFLVCVPLPISGESNASVLLGEFFYPSLIELVTNRLRLPALYAIEVDVDGQPVFERFPPDPVRASLREESVFHLFNQRIRIGLTPSEVALKRGRQLFPELVTVLGLGLSVLLGAVVNLARIAHVRRRAAEQANERLTAENEERRRAEQALRSSQAATRKLSLVASSTDNLVAITDATGRLEWVNDSFSRLLGFSLAEVMNRQLPQLLVSPDTDSSTVLRLRNALLEGVSFNADMACYARDGGRYDLHLDLQPVRNEAGVVENFIAILIDITTRVETENLLRRAKEEADAASRAKSEFLASMTHEIRTPMNGVIGMTSLLLETPLTPDQREFVNGIRSSGDALLSVINDILDFSKMESGKLELKQQPFELAECIENALDLFAVQAAAKRIDLAYCIDSDVPAWVLSDSNRLRQVLVNLLNNAVKFTPFGYVSVEVRRIAASVSEGRVESRPAADLAADASGSAPRVCLIEIAVRDTGIGIPPKKLDLLFKPFSQVDSSFTRRYGGTGLGLVICRRLCELMSGEIRVESEPGHGSVFTLTIPVEPVPLPIRASPEMLPSHFQGGTVLVIDGHAANRRFLTTTLAHFGLVGQSAETAGATRALALRLPPPVLIIVDHSLPNGIGRQLVLELRKQWRQPRLPVVLTLPAGESTPPALLAELAPALVLFKPLKVTPLMQTVRALLVSPGTSKPGLVPSGPPR